VRGRGVSYLVTLVFQLLYCPVSALPSLVHASPFPLPVPFPVLHRDISVDVLSRDVPTLALACIDVRCRVPARVRACLKRTFELCERIRGTVVGALDICLRSQVVDLKYP